MHRWRDSRAAPATSTLPEGRSRPGPYNKDPGTYRLAFIAVAILVVVLLVVLVAGAR